jgi:hypothetical protein
MFLQILCLFLNSFNAVLLISEIAWYKLGFDVFMAM